MNREKLEARLHAMGLPAGQVFMVLVLADEYGAYLIEKHARPPMRQRRGMPGDAQREWQDSQGPAS